MQYLFNQKHRSKQKNYKSIWKKGLHDITTKSCSLCIDLHFKDWTESSEFGHSAWAYI